MCCGLEGPEMNNTKRYKVYNRIYFNRPIGQIGKVFANGPKTRIQTQVDSYQRLKKWYLMPPCLTLSIMKYGSRVK